MTRNKTVLAVIALVALAIAGTAGTAAARATKPTSPAQRTQQASEIPKEIRVPQGHKAIATLPAEGVQTYECKNNEWVFLQPDAILKVNGVPLVLHSAGPVWTSIRDGSSVTGAVVASSPVDRAVPQLLLRATDNRGFSGDGLFSDVTFVQRLRTEGGVAPKVSCKTGQTVSVPYKADYKFWVAS
ncbi:MAG: DUF3455 domain-containing protein [Corynebacteriales bacterium]|nr:DUF3455 domain-containing protein [Mycobacteriales bacterium]